MVRATIDRETEAEDIGVIAQMWEEAYSEGLRQDADRYRQAMILAERMRHPGWHSSPQPPQFHKPSRS